MVRFRTLGQKLIPPAAHPPTIEAPPISQVPLPTVDAILAFADVVMGVKSSSSEALLLDKHKGKELAVGPSKRSKKKAGETSSAFLQSSDANAELLKSEFSTTELGKQVTVVDFDKDQNTSLALEWVVMLPRDVSELGEESSEAIRDLLVMQQVQVSILTSITSQFTYFNLSNTL